ncbi:MAG TPA: PqqD family protein [Elusimicrobiales bacterium]|nr:PqqD family protein [Elusimicrobiales bacterium]
MTLPRKKSGIIKISPDISWRQVGDEVVLLNTRTSSYYSLNPTGVRIWNLLAKGMPLEQIPAELASDYGITDAVAKKDVAELIKSLKDEKIIIVD